MSGIINGGKNEASQNNKVLLLLFFGVLMGALDISIVGPAIPSISETISVAQKDLAWIFSIYVLFNLVGIGLFAKLSDLYGRRNIYILTLIIFGAGSLVVSLSPSLDMLLAGRAIQGFGASGIFPVASAVVGDIFPPEKRGRALGLIGAVWGIAFIIGPVIAGILLAFFQWHMLFVVNIPIVIVLIFFSARLLESKKVESTKELDWKGILLLGLFLGSFTFGINSIDPILGWDSLSDWKVWPFLAFSIAVLALLIPLEYKASYPIVNPRLFHSRQIRIVGFLAIVTGLFQAAFIFIPDLAVQTFGVTSSQASFMLLPFVTATAIGSPIFGRMLDKLGSRTVILTGIFLSMAGAGLLAAAGETQMMFYFSGVLVGLGLSVLAGSALRYIMLNEVGAHERAITQGVLTIFISIGQIIGSQAIGSISSSGNNSADGYRRALFLLAGILLLSFFLSTRLKSRRSEAESR
jgi:EmrB/QacA subfamily drug resistance transporter